jgi:hypothetical protein
MSVYRIRKITQSWYGESIGVLILDAAYPCIPGNVGNATTFKFPICYEKVAGASIERFLSRRDPTLAQPFVEAARRLQNNGVRAITGACGFMALFQREVAAAVEIPVFLSSLLQIPFLHAITRRKVGIITADSTALGEAHFQALGIDPEVPLAIAGMQDQPEFSSAILREKGTLDSALIESEVIGVARKLMENDPDVGSILIECSDLPPYSLAIQRALGLPVFDFVTLINFVHSSLVPASYEGHM